MEKVFTDNYYDVLRLWTANNKVYLSNGERKYKEGDIDFEFDPADAIRIAEYLLRAARKTVKDDTV